MGRHAKHSVQLADGRRVGISAKTRKGFFRVLFRHPTEQTKYVESATGIPVPKGWHGKKSPPADWFTAAQQVVTVAYCPCPAGEESHDGNTKMTWAEAEALILEGVTRDASRRTYRSAFSLVRLLLPTVKGPSDVTLTHAEQFAKKYATSTYRRSAADTGTERSRSARTVKTTLNNLSVLWVRMKKLRVVSENVWAPIERPRVPKKLPRIPTEDAIDELFLWLNRRFSGADGEGWLLLKTFLGIKMTSGCRLNDLCQAKSSQFDPKAGTLRITSDHDKTHQERLITLAPELVGPMDSLKGQTFLWERYCTDSAVFRPGSRRATVFKPSVMYFAINSIFREYNAANPDKRVKTHDFRKRAITLTVMEMNGSIEAAAMAIPVTADTARGHYLDNQRAFNAADIQKKTAAILLRNGMGSANPRLEG